MFKAFNEFLSSTLLPGLLRSYRFLFPAIAAEFPSDYSLAESVERLRQAATPTSASAYLTRRTMVGNVSGREVWLQAFMVGARRGYYPMRFDGKFRQAHNGLVLAGRFTLTTGNKAYQLFCLCFLTVLTLGFIGQEWSRAHPVWWGPLPCLAFLVGLVFHGQFSYRTRNNVAWLSRIIIQTLTVSQPNQTLQVTAGGGGLSS